MMGIEYTGLFSKTVLREMLGRRGNFFFLELGLGRCLHIIRPAASPCTRVLLACCRLCRRSGGLSTWMKMTLFTTGAPSSEGREIPTRWPGWNHCNMEIQVSTCVKKWILPLLGSVIPWVLAKANLLSGVRGSRSKESRWRGGVSLLFSFYNGGHKWGGTGPQRELSHQSGFLAWPRSSVKSQS